MLAGLRTGQFADEADEDVLRMAAVRLLEDKPDLLRMHVKRRTATPEVCSNVEIYDTPPGWTSNE